MFGLVKKVRMNLRESVRLNFSKNIEFPDEIGKLCDWIQQTPIDYFMADFQLSEAAEDPLDAYFDNPEKYKQDITLFAHSANGGMFGIWRNQGKQKFIHLGSEGNEWYVLSDNPVDFLRLLAIGYSDVVGEDWNKAPAKLSEKRFAEWVESTFSVKIPQKGSEIATKTDRSLAEWIYSIEKPAKSFERFDPDNPLSWESYYGKLRVEIISIPADRKNFISEVRKLSDLSINALMTRLKNLPFIVFEGMCFIHGSRRIENLPEDLCINLINIRKSYGENVKILFKERSIEDCTNYDKYPEGAKVEMPEISEYEELK